MIITAHQPLYLPWSGFIHKIALADKFCILDDVQFADRDFIHRNRIASQVGSSRRLTIPVELRTSKSRIANGLWITWRKYLACIVTMSFSMTTLLSLKPFYFP